MATHQGDSVVHEERLQVQCRRIEPNQTIALRHAVLWPDYPLSQVILSEDAEGWHFGAFIPLEEEAVAVISLFAENCPIDDTGTSDNEASTPHKAVRFRKFACSPSYQGLGIGTQLLSHVASVARAELGGDTIWCDARTSSLDWYRRRGLEPFGKPFYKGPVEYTRMKMDIW
ncbi:hypothetical protein HGRIS_005577 [Hohenbuehelia grisea]|uniref:N-acetyltransferase domain-containing protein n=1 Tax=Hohenbuehelia grisea TaxID=104357 RepID=A0ABR3JYA6_9AGAR